MAPPRKRSRGAPRTVTRVTALASISSGGGEPNLRAAAEIIAGAARGLAWRSSVADSISVSVGDTEAVIAASHPAARPAELRLSHPLFGDREYWYGPPGRPFLAPAADQASDAAMVRYAKKIDAMAARAGFR